jgi:hypothetical protein
MTYGKTLPISSRAIQEMAKTSVIMPCHIRHFDGLTGSSVNSQKEGQVDQGGTIARGVSPSSLARLISPILLGFLLVLPWAP